MLGGMFFLISQGVYDLLSIVGLLRAIAIFLFGTLFLSWIIFWYNRMHTQKTKNIYNNLICINSTSCLFDEPRKYIRGGRKINFWIYSFFNYSSNLYFFNK